ncbi:MAG: tetratricopeptide repeat protein [Anaerolineales bacterium]|nr:tetratricopeptide repeat protein [Anaerolineales bacterium]
MSLNWLSSNPAGDVDELTSNYVRAFSDVIQIRRPSEGLKWLKAAELSSQRIGNFQLEANLALTQGALNLDRGEFDLAIEDFERSEKLFEAIGIMDGMYYARGNLGLVQHRRGNYPQAKHIYQQVIEMCESYQDRMGVAIGYLNLGDVHYCLKNYPEALLNLGESVKLFREEAARDFLVRALALMSKVQMSSNLPSQARESGEEAYRIAGLISSPGLLGLACQQMGDISASDGEMDVAETYFQKAIRLLTESNFQDELAEACIAYGKFLLNTGKSAASKQYFLEAAGIFEYMGAKFRMQEVDELLKNLQDI